MNSLFTSDFMPLWVILLTLLLFLPVRNLIFVLSVRRAKNFAEIDQDEQNRLKKRAGVTGFLLSFVFSSLYTFHLF